MSGVLLGRRTRSPVQVSSTTTTPVVPLLVVVLDSLDTRPASWRIPSPPVLGVLPARSPAVRAEQLEGLLCPWAAPAKTAAVVASCPCSPGRAVLSPASALLTLRPSRHSLTCRASDREENPPCWHTGHWRSASSHTEVEGAPRGPRKRVRVLDGCAIGFFFESFFVLFVRFFAGRMVAAGQSASWLELSSMSSISIV